MPSLRRVSGWEVVEALQRLGFAPVHQHGSHIVLKRQTPQGDIGCVVPLHRELAIGTLRAVLRQARETPEEFMEKLQQIGDQTPMLVGGWMLRIAALLPAEYGGTMGDKAQRLGH